MVTSVPREIVVEIEGLTGSTIRDFDFASGGCINNGGRIATSDGDYFLKWNDRAGFPGMFEAEAKGLSLLRAATSSLIVPKVAHAGQAETFQFLLMEYIADGRRGPAYWQQLGAGLAVLHRSSADYYGLDHDNYIGSLSQFNKPSGSWVKFFVEQRLQVQLQLAIDNKALAESSVRKFEKLFEIIPGILPEEAPALLHGDLWSGNVMTSPEGKPCLIDPAVYFGHREVDLAMTQLFGGFDATFLESYREAYPLMPGFEERLRLYNLYPLLVHVNLFGGGYVRQVLHELEAFL